MKFIHLTDPHLVDPARLLYGVDPRARLQLAVADINAHHADAAFVLVTGDLTHWGKAVGYAALAEVLAGLAVPCHLVLGNHDRRDHFAATFSQTPRDGHGFVQYTVSTPEGALVVLDTNGATDGSGILCERRLAWLAATLADTPGPLFLAMHHPPFDTGIDVMDAIGLVQKTAFAAVIEPHRARIRHLFFGHLHRPICGAWRGIPFSTIRSTCHQVALILGSQPHMGGNLEEPQYAVVLINADQVVVHFHDYAAVAPTYRFSDTQFRDQTQLVRPHDTRAR
jgi:Icc protein